MPYKDRQAKLDYLKKYVQQNKKRLSAKAKERYLRNKDLVKSKQKIYRDNNRNKENKRLKTWREKNPELCREYQKKYQQKNIEKIKLQRRKYREIKKEHINGKAKIFSQKNKQEWMKIINELGMDKCSKCGYDKCFEAIDFHHIMPEKKEQAIGNMLIKKVTDKRILELKKCIALCSNCHRELHYYAKTGL